METSLFNLCTRPRRDLSHAAVLIQMREMVDTAEQAGFDIAWFAEHHLSSYCITPSPLITCAHMAAHTRRIRVGPAVVVMPFYEPVRLIEDICFVDQLTGGRLVLGLGTGYQPREFDKFGFDIDNRLERGLETWDALHRALETGVIDFQGRHVQVRDAALAIAPLQQPIPVFAVGNDPAFRRRTLERGATPLCTPGAQSPEVIGTLRSLVSETAAELGIDDAALPFAVQRYVCVTDDIAEAREAARQVLEHARLAANMRRAEPVIDGAFLSAPPYEREPSIDDLMEYALIGSADRVTDRILGEASRWGITHLSGFFQFGDLPFDLARRSLDRFAADVLPRIASA